MLIRRTLSTGAIAMIFSLSISAPIFGQSAAREYTPKSGQPGKDVVWVPNPDMMVQKMLDMARVTRDDYVVDLGSGDGRNVIAAAKRGARAHGIEYDADLVDLAKRLAAKEGVRDRATFERGDVFVTDFSKATVIILFLTPEMNIRLRPKLLSLIPGARVVANYFAIGDWNPDEIATNIEGCERFCTARLWIVPAKVAGRWQMPQGELTLAQNYQTFSGTLREADGTFPVRGKLRGAEIFFGNQKSQYTGRVARDVIDGIARSSGVDHKFHAKRLTP